MRGESRRMPASERISSRSTGLKPGQVCSGLARMFGQLRKASTSASAPLRRRLSRPRKDLNGLPPDRMDGIGRLWTATYVLQAVDNTAIWTAWTTWTALFLFLKEESVDGPPQLDRWGHQNEEGGGEKKGALLTRCLPEVCFAFVSHRSRREYPNNISGLEWLGD